MKTKGTPSRQALLAALALTVGSLTGFSQPQQQSSPWAEPPAGKSPQPSVRAAQIGSAATLITQVGIGRIGEETLVRVEGSGRLTCQTERLNNPERLVLDFSGARLGLKRTSIPSALKPVLRVRLGQFKPDVARVVVDLDEHGVRYEVKSGGQSVTVAFAAASAAPASHPAASATPTAQEKNAAYTRRNEMAQPPARAAIDASRMPRPESLGERKAALANPVAHEAKAEPLENALNSRMLTFRAQNQLLRSVLEEIGGRAKVAITLADGLGEERLSVEFRNCRADEALRQILKDYDAFFFYGAAEEKTGSPSLKAVWVYPANRARGFKPAPPDVSAARATEVLIGRKGHQPTDELLEAVRNPNEKFRAKTLYRALSSGVEIPQEFLINLALNDASMSVRLIALRALPLDPKLRWVAERALYDSSLDVSELAREILSKLDAAKAPASAPAANQPKPPGQ